MEKHAHGSSTVQLKSRLTSPDSAFTLSVLELTSSSRSILYSAHLLWESKHCVLVAAGTAFGEIIYWSWNAEPDCEASSSVHRVFLGHEGSIFGVRISEELSQGCGQNLKRVVASCSDDRTIRIWDVSDIVTNVRHVVHSDHSPETVRTRHTGFSNAAFDVKPFSSSECLAIGWGHVSRVWTLRYLESSSHESGLLLLSTGEDASSRIWRLDDNSGTGADLPYKLVQQNCATYHSGKNLWSSSVFRGAVGLSRIVCGGADAKITTHPLTVRSRAHELAVFDLMSLARLDYLQQGADALQQTHRSSRMAEFFRSYSFLDQDSFLLTTNSGRVFIGTITSDLGSESSYVLSAATFVDQLDDLCGYSLCIGEPAAGVAFVAGSKGSIYVVSKLSGKCSKVTSITGKIGEMFTAGVVDLAGRIVAPLLATIVGKRMANLLYVDVTEDCEPRTVRAVDMLIPEQLTGTSITSMTITVTSDEHVLYIGFRRGSVAVYRIRGDQSEAGDGATLIRVIENAHGHETVTALSWRASCDDASAGYLISVGRDGRHAIHYINMCTNSVELVHNLTLPIGPNIEGIYFHQDHLIVHGFSSKKWVLYNVTAEREIMSVETGGAHRSWAFSPSLTSKGGGTLVWTRASSMHICSQTGPNHSVVRPGNHGREIKSVAISGGLSSRLIATGAEDTDIKISEYTEGELLCHKTLRKHTTGIQHLQWSADGEYLFSSGGCEEFYIWRIRQLPLAMGVGVVCESVYSPESEHSDLRIMSFDVTYHEAGYNIAMVFSDSSLKVKTSYCSHSFSIDTLQVYRYSPKAAVTWYPVAKGIYFTSCLMQCMFINSESLLTIGTDGHAVVWPLPSANPTASCLTLTWQQPLQVHQSSSKSMASCHVDDSRELVISGGDDGSLAILLLDRVWSTKSGATAHASSPVLLSRAHASAVTACAVTVHKSCYFVLTSGNDQWVRLWQIQIIHEGVATGPGKSVVRVSRVGKMKTNVADVSSIALLDSGDSEAKALVCGVGMEVVRVAWERGI